MKITKENFSDAWKQIDRKYRYSKKCVVIGSVVNTIGEMLFAGGMIAGIAYATFKKVVDVELLLENFKTAAVLAVAICFAWALLVHIIYHPFRTKYTEDAWAENAKSMVELAEKTRDNIKKLKRGISNLSWCIYILAVMIDVTGHFTSAWQSCLYQVFLKDYVDLNNGGLIVMPLAELILFGFVHSIFKFITKWSFFCPVSYKEVVRAEEFRVEIEEELVDKSEKEKEVLSDILLEKGISAYANKEYKEAKEMFLKSALLGNVAGMDRIALHYAGVVMDKEIAVYWYKKCIASGDKSKMTKKHLRMAKNGIRVDYY